MPKKLRYPILYTTTKGIKGVEFEIKFETERIIKTASKLVNPFSVVQMLHQLKSYIKDIVYVAAELDYYRDYEQKIDKEIAEQAAHNKEHKQRGYQVGGNLAFFTQTKHTVAEDIHLADNHTAAEIIKAEYTKDHPDNRLSFDAEMSYCYIHAPNQKEAKQFMHWMNEHYYKPFADSYADDLPILDEAWENATEEERRDFMSYLYR